MDRILISNKTINIMSLVFYFPLLILSILFQYFNFGYLDMKLSLSIVLFPFILILFHEIIHYAGFLLFSKIKAENLILRFQKPIHIPYVSTTSPMNNKSYIYVLLLPTIIIALIASIPVILSPNIINSLLFTASVCIGTSDFLLAIRLMKLDKTTMIQTSEEGWGVMILPR